MDILVFYSLAPIPPVCCFCFVFFFTYFFFLFYPFLFPVDCPLKSAPYVSYRLLHLHTLYLPCHSQNPQCSPSKWWTLVLQGLQCRNYWTTSNKSYAFKSFFESVFGLVSVFCNLAICSERNIVARSTGKRWVRQRPSVPDFSWLCGRRSVKILTIKKNERVLLQIWYFWGIKYISRQNKVIQWWLFFFAKIAPENSGLRSL